eukprot:366503-Chlamydomonas_euryale.AAC.4
MKTCMRLQILCVMSMPLLPGSPHAHTHHGMAMRHPGLVDPGLAKVPFTGAVSSCQRGCWHTLGAAHGPDGKGGPPCAMESLSVWESMRPEFVPLTTYTQQCTQGKTPVATLNSM